MLEERLRMDATDVHYPEGMDGSMTLGNDNEGGGWLIT
jgi:hypothetical protein